MTSLLTELLPDSCRPAGFPQEIFDVIVMIKLEDVCPSQSLSDYMYSNTTRRDRSTSFCHLLAHLHFKRKPFFLEEVFLARTGEPEDN